MAIGTAQNLYFSQKLNVDVVAWANIYRGYPRSYVYQSDNTCFRSMRKMSFSKIEPERSESAASIALHQTTKTNLSSNDTHGNENTMDKKETYDEQDNNVPDDRSTYSMDEHVAGVSVTSLTMFGLGRKAPSHHHESFAEILKHNKGAFGTHT